MLGSTENKQPYPASDIKESRIFFASFIQLITWNEAKWKQRSRTSLICTIHRLLQQNVPSGIEENRLIFIGCREI